ncbi:Bug family tripartite tricarboxylate transporter substrate binding protein [Halomonas sp. V046]|uniref:Bug family tripartite tricarboxylate transporter substrate binding protein n=1 Tax=Halomonas sp. V046 TaxID=3459611 RepID=UPI0040447683
MKTTTRTSLIAGLLASLVSVTGLADTNWPQKPVHLMVPYPPGGNVDLIGRTLSEPLSRVLGQPVVVENRAGAGGTIASGEVARADADGYTLLIGDIATHGINPHVYANLAYDPVADFAPIVQITSVPLVMGVGPKLEVATFEEFMALATSSPERIDYASAGNGTPQQLAFEYFKAKTGIEGLHIPYKGSAPARTALIAGEIGVFIDGTLVPSVEEGTVTALAVTGAERSAALPDVPTLMELGVDDYRFASWHGLFAPAGTPVDVIDTLNAAVNEVLAEPEVQARFAAVNIGLVGGTPEAFADHVDQQSQQLGELVGLAGAGAP